MQFTIEHLNKYLTEAEDVGGFEMRPILDENPVARKDPELRTLGYTISRGGKDICRLEIHNNSNEELEDFDVAQSEPAKYTVYISEVEDRFACDEYKNKLVGIGFINIVDKDEKYKKDQKDVEEKKV